MRERVFGVVRAREGGRASARGRVGFADETSGVRGNELETTISEKPTPQLTLNNLVRVKKERDHS